MTAARCYGMRSALKRLQANRTFTAIADKPSCPGIHRPYMLLENLVLDKRLVPLLAHDQGWGFILKALLKLHSLVCSAQRNKSGSSVIIAGHIRTSRSTYSRKISPSKYNIFVLSYKASAPSAARPYLLIACRARSPGPDTPGEQNMSCEGRSRVMVTLSYK